jgi:predicted nucleic acid-binding protein
VTSTIASAYATIQADLMSRGKARLRINDGWIAATALEHHLTLVTSDTHLKSLADMLRVEDWRE